MDTDAVLYVEQLKAITTSQGSNAYLRKWAQLWLKEIQYQRDLLSRSRQTLIRLSTYAPQNDDGRPVTNSAVGDLASA